MHSDTVNDPKDRTTGAELDPNLTTAGLSRRIEELRAKIDRGIDP